jgi:antitoxin (DNA-binding transcriptional repressor) of toxin-antitoxin stability system
MDGTVEAGPGLKELLERVRRGETLTITEGGAPVARLVPQPDEPPPPGSEDARRAAEELRRFRERHTLGGLSWKELRDAGRRY